MNIYIVFIVVTLISAIEVFGATNAVGDGWIELEDLNFNGRRKTFSFWVDHFTSYGWAY